MSDNEVNDKNKDEELRQLSNDRNAELNECSSDEVAPSFNPSVSDDDDDNELIRGDAIGDTLYSERYVLSTLLKLVKVEKPLEDDEDFEKDLCALWDMTIEVDVVKLLLEHNVLELFAQCIDITEDKRLTEILVGMIGNMCTISQTRVELSKKTNVMATLLDLVGCSDSLTLIQLMRLLTVVLVAPTDEEAEDMTWFKHFCLAPNFLTNFCFLLNNGINQDLLKNALEALNAMLAKFALLQYEAVGDSDERSALSFTAVFLKEDISLVKSSIVAFKSLHPKRKVKPTDDEEAVLPTQSARKTMQIFLNIHSILTEYVDDARRFYLPHKLQMIACLDTILEPLCEPMCLLPLSRYELDLIDSVNSIFVVLADPFDVNCIAQLITIWLLVTLEIKTFSKHKPAANDFEDDTDEDKATQEQNKMDNEYFCTVILQLLTRSISHANSANLQQTLQQHTPNTVVKLLSALEAAETKDDTNQMCCNKIRTAFKSLNVAVNS